MILVSVALTNVFGIGAICELVFAIITLLIGIFAFRIYRLTKSDNYRAFMFSFFFIATAYLFKSLINFLIYFEQAKPIAIASKLANISTFFAYGVIVHIVLMLIALLLLVNLVMKIKNRGVFVLLFILTFFPLVLTWMHYSIFYSLASVFLFILTVSFFKNYIKNKNKNAFYVGIAFLLIFIAHIFYILISVRTLFFVIGHVFEFLGYLVLLITYIRVLKK